MRSRCTLPTGNQVYAQNGKAALGQCYLPAIQKNHASLFSSIQNVSNGNSMGNKNKSPFLGNQRGKPDICVQPKTGCFSIFFFPLFVSKATFSCTSLSNCSSTKKGKRRRLEQINSFSSCVKCSISHRTLPKYTSWIVCLCTC